MIAHIQAVAVAQRYVRQVLGLDLDDGNIVVLVSADILGVIAVAVVQCDLHGIGVAYHMVIGDDIAIRRQDEAGTGAGGLCGLAKEVRVRGGSDVDGHHAVDVGGVQLRVRHGGFPVHGLDLNFRRPAVGDIHLCGIAVGPVAHKVRRAAAYQAAQQGAHQRQGRDLHADTALCGLVLGLLSACRAIAGGLALRLHIVLALRLLLALRLFGLLLTVAVDLLVYAGLLCVIALARLRTVLAVGVVIQVIFIVIHKSNLLESVRLNGFRLELS